MKVVLDLKVVMDTNVFVSGVFFSGPPYQILKAWQSGEFELVASQEISSVDLGLLHHESFSSEITSASIES